ncbi:MAG: hypothetical protein GY720_12615 [bacterium]|nr:hypothetical protein [bacterium]
MPAELELAAIACDLLSAAVVQRAMPPSAATMLNQIRPALLGSPVCAAAADVWEPLSAVAGGLPAKSASNGMVDSVHTEGARVFRSLSLVPSASRRRRSSPGVAVVDGAGC